MPREATTWAVNWSPWLALIPRPSIPRPLTVSLVLLPPGPEAAELAMASPAVAAAWVPPSRIMGVAV